ncbi:hypothetical protein BU15DRAFT_46061, partial [Melanogaster broomeanus]
YRAHVLTTQGPSRLIDAELHIERQRATLAELVALYNDEVPVVHVDALPVQCVSSSPVRQFLHQNFIKGGSSNGYNAATGTDDGVLAKSDNIVWEDIRG